MKSPFRQGRYGGSRPRTINHSVCQVLTEIETHPSMHVGLANILPIKQYVTCNIPRSRVYPINHDIWSISIKGRCLLVLIALMLIGDGCMYLC